MESRKVNNVTDTQRPTEAPPSEFPHDDYGIARFFRNAPRGRRWDYAIPCCQSSTARPCWHFNVGDDHWQPRHQWQVERDILSLLEFLRKKGVSVSITSARISRIEKLARLIRPEVPAE